MNYSLNKEVLFFLIIKKDYMVFATLYDYTPELYHMNDIVLCKRSIPERILFRLSGQNGVLT